MDDQSVKSKKKVTFGKARVRLVFNYYNQEFAQSEDTDEKTSRKIAKMKQPPPHPQKQPKSILKPSTRAVSVDSGLNALHRVPQRNFEKIDKNFWEPAKHKRSGRRRQASLSDRELENRETNSESDLLKNDDKSVAKQQNTNFSEGEMNVASNEDDSAKDEPSTEKPAAVKNNEKWEGITASYPHGLNTTSQTFVGIYSGVEADWDQIRQSLSRIGVDVGEHRLQDPRDFVTIMNMLLSAQKEKSDNQTARGTEQDIVVVDRPAEKQDSNNNVRRVKENTIPENPVVDLNEKDPVTKEELTSAKLGAIHKNQKPAISKEEWKKRIKKLKMKGLIPRKKENSSRKERSYSESNLNDLPMTDCKVTTYEQHSSFDRFRSKMKMNSSNSCSNNSKLEKERRRGSTSECSLDSFSRLEVEKTGKRDDCSSVEYLSCDDEGECSSTSMDSSSTTHKDSSDAHFYSDNDLDFPGRVSLDGSLRRDRSFSTGPKGGSGRIGEDLKHKKERPKVVKRDSWVLTRKQQMKGESEKRSNLKEENVKEGRKVIRGNDKGGGIDLEKQFKIRGTITQKTSCVNNSERRCGNITQTARGTEQDIIVVDRPAEIQDSNNNVRRVREENTIPENPVVELNERDPITKEELTSAKLGATHKNQKPAISKEEWKKRMKKLKMKGLIPRKKENSSRKERSYSESNLNDLPMTDCKVTTYEQHSSFDRFRSKMKMNSSNSSSNNSKLEKERRRGRKRSTSECSLDSFSRLEVEKTGKRDDCSSVEYLSCDDEGECSSTSMDSSSTTHKDSSDAHFYSDNDLDFPGRVSLDGSLRRDRSFSTGPKGGSGRIGEDLKHKKERPKVVKRDSWFLTRKQQMKGESEKRSNLKEGNVKDERKVIEGNDKGGGIDLEKQFKIRGTITQRKSCDNDSERRRGKITQKKSSVEEASTSGSELENRNKSSKQKAESESSAELDERSNPKDGQNRKNESGINSESQLKMTQRKTYSDQVKEDSTSGSELDNGNKILKAKDHKNEQTLLAISSQSGSEKEDSGLSTCASVETVGVPGNEQSSSNIVENTNKAEHLDVNDSVKQSETNRTIENQENFKITSKNEEHTKRKKSRTDSIDGNNSHENECLADKKFLNDLWFIDAETKRSLRSEEYLQKARKRYVHKRNSCLETNLALRVMEAISKNPAAGILLPFTN
ncbi:Hypothetical predicted protein [Paramuricea clavata]|uniref:Uncharacterized protein n=1 Tax=Paramuricea clavata TaxID=317549 RepID=A0A7D9HCZ2_PARCT|nr:Hypothetical predicted protein [Paramuricea clavata]